MSGDIKSEIAGLKEAFEYHRSESARKGHRISALQTEVYRLRALLEQMSGGPGKGGDNPKSFNTLLKLVGGMAMAIYGYNPDSGRNEVASQIQNDLDLKGVNLDADTIRKWLRESARLIKTAEKHEPKPK